MFKFYISVLGVYILPLDWPGIIPEVYKAPRLWRRIHYSEKKGVPAVTRKTAIMILVWRTAYISFEKKRVQD